MRGALQRGDFPRLAYRLGRGAATGVLTVTEAGRPHVLYLRRGFVIGSRMADAADNHDVLAAAATMDRAAIAAARRRQTEQRLERLAALPVAEYTFASTAGPPAVPTATPPAARTAAPPGVAADAGARPCTLPNPSPFAIATWARRHVESRLDAVRARAMLTDLAGARLALRKDLAPDPADCDDTDRRILEGLAAPRRLDELERAAHAPRFRLLAFVHFLSSIGALEPIGVGAPRPQTQPPWVAAAAWGHAPPLAPSPRTPDDARRLLGVPSDADAAAVKRAYRRLAREWHPDMHPEAAGAVRQALEARFAALNQAYRTIAG